MSSVLVVVRMANPATAALPNRATFKAPYLGGSTTVSNTTSTCGSGSATSTSSANLTTGNVIASATGSASKGADCARADTQSGIGVVFTANHTTSALPPGRNDAMMTYDARDRYVVLFGGTAGAQTLGDTWKFTNGSWSAITTTPSPPAAAGAEMVYDAADGYVLLYDGPCGSSCNTWSFAGGLWKNITPSQSPTMRNVGYLGYDAADRCVILFGGFTGSAYVNDTWKFHNGTWTQLKTPVAPSPRADSNEGGLVYDARDRYLVLFGGDAGWGSAPYYNDTWTFSHGSWKQISPSVVPAARAYQTMSYDPQLRAIVLFGGIANPRILRDTWLFSGGNWTNVTPAVSPPESYAPSSVYDPMRGSVLLFGGGNGTGSSSALSETWTYRGGAWNQTSAPATISVNWSLQWAAQTKALYICTFYVWGRCFRHTSSSAAVEASINILVTDITPNRTHTPSFGAFSPFVDLYGSSTSNSPAGGITRTVSALGGLHRNHTYLLVTQIIVKLSVTGATYTLHGTSRNLSASAYLYLNSPYGGTLNWVAVA